MLVTDWNSKEIKVMKSKGGKMSACNYKDNIIIPEGVSVWPHPDILKKLYKSNQIKSFNQISAEELKSIGFYSDLQSLGGEDAITWSVFGTLHYFPESAKVDFINSLLALLKENVQVKHCILQLWTRIAHPDNLVPGGPELDFIFISDRVAIFGESKWQSGEAKNQGREKNKTQLQLRNEYFKNLGDKIFPSIDRKIVLLVALEEEKGSPCSFISWDDVCNKTTHPLGDEIRRYYKWKKDVLDNYK